MGEEIAQRSRTRFRFIQSPPRRKLRVAEPILQIRRAIMIDGSYLAGIDQLARQRNGGCTSIVVTDHVNTTMVLCGFEHLLGFGEGVGQRLLAKEYFSCFGRGKGDWCVRV